MGRFTGLEWSALRGMVRAGNFETAPAPFGIQLKFFGQDITLGRLADGRYPKINLFIYREYCYHGAFRVRLQITGFVDFTHIVCDGVINLWGMAVQGYRSEMRLMVGTPIHENPNYPEGEQSLLLSDRYDEWYPPKMDS